MEFLALRPRSGCKLKFEFLRTPISLPESAVAAPRVGVAGSLEDVRLSLLSANALKPLSRALSSELSTSYRQQEDTTFSLTKKRQRYTFKRAGKDQDCVLVVARIHGKRVAHGIDRRCTNASSRLSQLLAENFVRAW